MQAELRDKKREIVDFFLDKGVLLDAAILEKLMAASSIEQMYETLKNLEGDHAVLDDEVLALLGASNHEVPAGDGTVVIEQTEQTQEQEVPKRKSRVKIMSSYDTKPAKRSVQDFVQFFRTRLKAMEKVLMGRRELGGKVTSIRKILAKTDREEIGLIGLIKTKSMTKNGNLMFEIEDLTGEIKVLVNKTRQDIFNIAKDFVEDEVVGIIGTNGDKIVFANNVVQPDIRLDNPFKKAPDEVYAAFISDLHTGSNNFLYSEFNKFIKWMAGELGTPAQKAIAAKVKYLFIGGDLVDGVGIYPRQEEELDITDITKQYELVAQMLKKIPEHVELIIIPGNHDACRLAEPQLVFYKDYAKPIYDLPNATICSNPSIVNIHAGNGFPGFNVLMYHGYSFIHYADKVNTLRTAGGVDRPDLLMKFLLQRRHLAPTHGSATYVPDKDQDPLIISHTPDFFISGHIHKASVSNYRNVTMICGSCWQSITSFEEKLGLNPEPGRVPVVNLQTRECRIIKFIDN